MRRLALPLLILAATSLSAGQTSETVIIRGHAQTVHLLGRRGGDPVVVASGDGGWLHLAPHVAQMLASRGFFVVGFDTKAYLESFTTSRSTLQTTDEPRDFQILADFAARGSTRKPILIGVSEGAGLSLLAATDPQTRSRIDGVIGLGMPDLNELGWRWKDSIIYLTHTVPNEPTFRTSANAAQVSPAPLAAIHSTHDEFVPVSEIQRVLAAAKEPKRLWIINAADHGFSNNLPELDRTMTEAIAWVRQHAVS